MIIDIDNPAVKNNTIIYTSPTHQLHIVPAGDDAVLDGVLAHEQASQSHGFVPTVRLLF